MSKHIVMTHEGGASALSEKALPEFDAADFPSGWKGLGVEDSGIFMFLFNISADALEFPIHASPDAWLAYVVSGAGHLYSGSTEMEQGAGVEYQEGDFISFEGNTPHGWKNGDAPSRILFAKQA